MSFEFSEKYKRFDITPLENIFMTEYMPKAPGDYIKVYLYCLNLCYQKETKINSFEQLSEALDLSATCIEQSLYYWHRTKLIEFTKKDNEFSIKFYSAKEVFFKKDKGTEELYKYKKFNARIQKIFKNRMLTPNEYNKIYDWIEIFHLPEMVLIMMISYFYERNKGNININYLDKVAKDWAEKEINTPEKAENYLETIGPIYRNTSILLRYLGMFRQPTQDEVLLYKKWSQTWGFSLKAMQVSCSETTKSRNPSMAYLDKILENLYNQGITDAESVKTYFDKHKASDDNVKEMLTQAGIYTRLTQSHRDFYEKWNNIFVHEAIILGSKQISGNNNPSIDGLNRLLSIWQKNGNISPQDIVANQKKMLEHGINLQSLFEALGETRNPGSYDFSLYMKWCNEYKFEQNMLEKACEYASNSTGNKMAYLNKILESWNQRGIKTPEQAEEARREHLAGKKYVASSNNKPEFEQHVYTKEELDSLYFDFSTVNQDYEEKK